MFRIKMHHSVLVLSLGKNTMIHSWEKESSNHIFVFSLGLAYAGTNREDVIELISNALREGSPSMEVRHLDLGSFSFFPMIVLLDYFFGLSFNRYHWCWFM